MNQVEFDKKLKNIMKNTLVISFLALTIQGIVFIWCGYNELSVKIFVTTMVIFLLSKWLYKPNK